MASGDVNVQNNRSISGCPRRAIVAAAPPLLASLALHGAGTTSQIDGTTGAQAKLLAARKGLGVEDGWRDSDRCGDLQRHNIPVGAMRKYCLFSFAGIYFRVPCISHTGMCLPQHWEAVEGAASYASPRKDTCACQSLCRRHRL
jgi:hypothetical protein